MTNAKHTPGPWVWRDDVNTGEYDLSPGVLTTNLTDGTPWGDEIDRANGRLIAAAPELLEALAACEKQAEEVRLILINHLNEPERTAFWKAINIRDLARAAIAKAEGRDE